jgi:hypothetical protein
MSKHAIALATMVGILVVVTTSTLPLIVHAEAGAATCPRENRCVRIDVEVRTGNAGAGDLVRSSSLGTVVAPGLILTHNHHTLLNRTGGDGILVITESSGTSWHVSLSDLALQPLDDGTLLIQLPGDVALTRDPLLPIGLDPRVQPGDWLRIAFRRPNTDTIELASFEVVQVLVGRIKLADPRHVIQSGCSGGGAYLDGLFIGNTWSIDKVEGRTVGTFTVALLPEALPTAVAALSGTGRDGEPDDGDEGLMGSAR